MASGSSRSPGRTPEQRRTRPGPPSKTARTRPRPLGRTSTRPATLKSLPMRRRARRLCVRQSRTAPRLLLLPPRRGNSRRPCTMATGQALGPQTILRKERTAAMQKSSTLMTSFPVLPQCCSSYSLSLAHVAVVSMEPHVLCSSARTRPTVRDKDKKKRPRLSARSALAGCWVRDKTLGRICPARMPMGRWRSDLAARSSQWRLTRATLTECETISDRGAAADCRLESLGGAVAVGRASDKAPPAGAVGSLISQRRDARGGPCFLAVQIASSPTHALTFARL